MKTKCKHCGTYRIETNNTRLLEGDSLTGPCLDCEDWLEEAYDNDWEPFQDEDVF